MKSGKSAQVVRLGAFLGGKSRMNDAKAHKREFWL